MAWEISISTEGWQQLRDKLDDWDRSSLIEAITDDTFERVYEKGGEHHAQRAADAERKRLESLSHDLLADRAYELIEQNCTCDNGGFAYWIDREGYHKVVLE
ncbi:hypothetical protein [Thalassoroseus pseudoceratinae]|uniref:hypothetical protein n=1 Tax=Thalassoroseus pseudoceratinae TaxID=2713176 RepID=UPI001421847B|nr:hypothetical protein [Thalassoroseus pseudoceratinae]